MASIVGVNVKEVDGKSSPVLQPAPTSVAAIQGLTDRGVPARPVRVSSMQQFEARFGPRRGDGYLGYALAGFFLNGGQTAYVARVVGAGSSAANTTLNNDSGGAALQLEAGYRGHADPGPWGERLRVDLQSDPRITTTLAGDSTADATSVALGSAEGIGVGYVLRFQAGANVHFRRVTQVTGSTVEWASSEPISAVMPAAETVVSGSEFRLTVRYQATPRDVFETVETYRHLSLDSQSDDYALDRLNHEITGSRYLVLTDPAADAIAAPAAVANRALSGGTETAPAVTDYAGSDAARTGLHAFNTEQVQLVAIPDAQLLGDKLGDVISASLAYCASRGDCMFVGSIPDRKSKSSVVQARALADYAESARDYAARAETFAAAFQAKKVFGALYAGWIRVNDPAATNGATSKFVPSEGHVMGVYARTEQTRGIHKAPAGIGAQLRGALDVSVSFTEKEHTSLVRNGLVNGVRYIPGTGIHVSTSRTLSSDTRWWFVNVRLLFNFVKSTLRDGLRFVRQEPHSAELRRTVSLNVVTPFLLGLWRQGAFGSDPPADVFTVKCDAENNPPDQVDIGNFKLEVYFYPVKPAETIFIVVGQQPSGATSSES